MPIALFLGQENWIRDATAPKNKAVVSKLQILYFFQLKKAEQPVR